MTPLHTDSELFRAAQLAQSPVVRVLAQRLADRGTQAATARETLAAIRARVDAGKHREALALIDTARAALDWARSIPNHNEVKP
jgi:hypothetical protein